MSAPFEPFLLGDFETGMSQSKEPWLSPRNSWREIDNGYVFRGRLRKRPGFQNYGGLGTEVSAEVVGVTLLGVVNGYNVYAGQVANTPVLPPGTVNDSTKYALKITANLNPGPGSTVFYDSGQKSGLTEEGTSVIRRAGAADEFTSDAGALNRSDGTFIFQTLDTEGVFGNVTAVDYDYSDGNPCMGIITYQDQAGADVSIAASTDAVFRWNSSSLRWEKLAVDTGVSWTGADDDFFWFEPFGDILTINNGIDKPVKYDSSASPPLILMDTDYTGSGASIRSAKAAVRYKSRLLYFALDDDGTGVKLDRVRWTQVGNPEGFDRSTDFIDAPTNDPFVTTQLLGDRILVGFTRGWWELEATQDPIDPFRWRRIPSEEGAVSLRGGVSFSEQALFRSPTSISGIDGLGQANIDQDIPDYTVAWNPVAAKYTYATRYDQLRQVWWSYAGRGDDKPESILVLQTEPGKQRSYARWDFAGVSCFGDTRNESSLLWDDLYQSWDSYDFAWDSAASSAGFPQVLVGKRDGLIHIVKPDTDDDGSAFMFKAQSQRLSPYPSTRTRFGYVDFQADSVPGGSVVLRFRKDFETADFIATTIPLDPSEGSESSEKIVRRVPINAIGLFLSITIESENTHSFSLDFLEVWAKPAGPHREVA